MTSEINNSNTGNHTVYQIVTDRVLAQLEAGVAPWGQELRASGTPRNLISQRAYRGINALLLGTAGFSSPYWLTFRQVQENGGGVLKGSKSEIVVFWQSNETEEAESETTTDKTRQQSKLRYYRVFNYDQTEALDSFVPEAPSAIDIPATDIAAYLIESISNRPAIEQSKPSAFYSPTKDYISLPKIETFECPEDYYVAAFHQLIHATGHASRLNRPSVANAGWLPAFGSPDYSRETLIAEIGSALLCAHCGLTNTIKASDEYFKGWLDALENDNRIVVSAAGAAQKAVDFILGPSSES